MSSVGLYTDHICHSVVTEAGWGASEDSRQRRRWSPTGFAEHNLYLGWLSKKPNFFCRLETCSTLCKGTCTKNTHACVKHVPCVFVCFCHLRGLQSNIFSELDWQLWWYSAFPSCKPNVQFPFCWTFLRDPTCVYEDLSIILKISSTRTQTQTQAPTYLFIQDCRKSRDYLSKLRSCE